MASHQHPHDDPESDGYDYDYDYDYDAYNPSQTAAPYAPIQNSQPTYTSMLNNTLGRIQTSIVQRISPSRTVQSNLATVPEASEEGSDRQSVMTTSTGDDAVSTPTKKFTEHSLSEVRRVNQQEQHHSSDERDDPFADGPRDSRSIAYRFASALRNSPNGLPLPANHLSRETTAYASGASRSPTPLRETSRYRRVQDEEQGSEDYYGDQEEKEDYEDDMDVAESLKPYPQWKYTFGDPEKSSLTSSGSSTLDGAYPASPLPTRHFGPAPVGRVQRRHKKMKKAVRLTNGNLVVDLNVPPKLVKILPVVGGVRYEEKSEMTKTRYTAVTCDPDEFEKQGFFLRQNELGRTTELFIVITMYNVRLCSHLFPTFIN